MIGLRTTTSDPSRPSGIARPSASSTPSRDVGATRIVSSPFVRCRQTLDPLAQRLRLPLELSDALAEGVSLTDTLRLFDKVSGETAVLCTHGDVVGNVIAHLASTGVPIDDDRLEKGSIWMLDTRDGEIVGARYLPAPG